MAQGDPEALLELTEALAQYLEWRADETEVLRAVHFRLASALSCRAANQGPSSH
jgi:hypothetical protein